MLDTVRLAHRVLYTSIPLLLQLRILSSLRKIRLFESESLSFQRLTSLESIHVEVKVPVQALMPSNTPSATL